MLFSCSDAEKNLLSSCIGKKLNGIIGYKHPGIPAYRQILLQFADWAAILELRAISIAPKFEVFVIQVNQSQPVGGQFGRDELILSDFMIVEIDVMRRVEWIEGEESGSRVEVSVDAGLVLKGSNGIEIEFEADAFPLTFQLRFIAGGSGGGERTSKRFIPIARS